MINNITATDHYFTIEPARGGWLVREHKDGHCTKEEFRDTRPEADALKHQWAEQTPHEP